MANADCTYWKNLITSERLAGRVCGMFSEQVDNRFCSTSDSSVGQSVKLRCVARVLSHCLARDGFFRAECGPPLCWTDLPGQRIKLLGERHGSGAIDSELAFANHVHELDAGKHIAGRSE